jgi:hypothetical protein
VGCSTTRPEAALWADLARGKNRLAKFGKLGEALDCQITEFPGSPGMQAPRFGGFCFGGVGFRSNDDYGTRANHFAREASVPQNAVAFKEASAKPSDS